MELRVGPFLSFPSLSCLVSEAWRCIAVYKTEPELGLAIKESGVDRSKLYITTKVMGSIADPANALKTSLKKLQVDYVDLYVPNSTYLHLS
jgi:diketogulonate reductase-like aldo/keto reductase